MDYSYDSAELTILAVGLGTAVLAELVLYLLRSIGFMQMFRKSGRKRWLAFIPVVRDYQLSLIAEMEEEGRTYCIITACAALSRYLSILLPNDNLLDLVFKVAKVVFAIGVVVYGIRIYLGLCKIYQRRRLWIIMWILFEPITALLWGFGKKFQPTGRTEENDSAQAASLSGASAEELSKGLTLNLTDRTVTEFFRKRYLLRDMHLAIPRGHLVLLLGGSGAGKTTFLNAVTGYEKANAVVTMDSRNIYKEYESMKYDIGFVPQQDLMRGSDTVLMTLKDAARLRLPSGMKRKERNERIQKVLEQFGLASVRGNLTSKLSGGQRKRLSIAMEMISDPSLFILDEPDSGLDGVVARNLFRSLREIADEGKIVIVITHTPDRVIDLFDDVIVLAKDANRTGRLAFYGSVEEAYSFFDKKSMEEILLTINQKDEGGEGRADEFVEKYGSFAARKAG